jgi:hypothetical protein
MNIGRPLITVSAYDITRRLGLAGNSDSGPAFAPRAVNKR